MAQQQRYAIFDNIDRNDLEAVKAHVLADAGVLEERERFAVRTPLIYDVRWNKPYCSLAHRAPGTAQSRDEG